MDGVDPLTAHTSSGVPCWVAVKSFSTREGKPGAKADNSPREGKEMSQAQPRQDQQETGPKSRLQHESKVSQETKPEIGQGQQAHSQHNSNQGSSKTDQTSSVFLQVIK